MNCIIEKMPSYNIVFIRRVGEYGIGNNQTMEELKQFAKQNNLLNDKSIILGIAQDNPELTEASECRYDACLVVADDFEFDNKTLQKSEISGGKYLVFTINHTQQEVEKAWSMMFIELENLDCKIDVSRPILERYASEKLKEHKCEICIPIL